MKTLGKINQQTINHIFPDKAGSKSDKVIQGPAFGVDTACIDLRNGKVLVTASDPLSILPNLGMKASAWLSVHLIANDVATSGQGPQFAQFVLNLPDTLGKTKYLEYWNYMHLFCKEIGVSITGGHTGFSDIGNSTLAGGGTMFSVVDKESVKSSAKAKPDQNIIATKSAALSSSAILAKSFPKYIESNLGKQILETAQANFYKTSILPEITAINQEPSLLPHISALHDVTEGGVLGALYEMSEASNVGVKIEIDKILVNKEVSEICALFEIDPLASIGAGCLLIVCEESQSQAIINRLNKNDIQAVVIGKTCAYEEGKTVYKNGKTTTLNYQETDPYWAAYFNALTNKLD
ncbi:MAG TPA: AIR synthase-related protein [Flavobacteriaceae bacterium]|nr:AIR synthase-related protein [Flavobacteriaceae bacterium]